VPRQNRFSDGEEAEFFAGDEKNPGPPLGADGGEGDGSLAIAGILDTLGSGC